MRFEDKKEGSSGGQPRAESLRARMQAQALSRPPKPGQPPTMSTDDPGAHTSNVQPPYESSTARRPPSHLQQHGHASPATAAAPAIDAHVSGLAIYCAKLPNTTINSFCGAMGGVASGIVTCPLDVIKTRLQAQGSFRRNMRRGHPGTALYQGLMGTARVIWKEDGVRGMYRGLGPMLLGYLPTWAVYMAVYDSSREWYYTKLGQ